MKVSDVQTLVGSFLQHDSMCVLQYLLSLAGLSVCLSDCLSVCYMLALCQNDAGWDHEVFTVE